MSPKDDDKRDSKESLHDYEQGFDDFLKSGKVTDEQKQ